MDIPAHMDPSALTTTSGLTDQEMRAWKAFLLAHHRVTRTLDRELVEEHGLPLATYEVLLQLARAPGRQLRMSALADRVLLSPSGITRLVDRMVRDGLVERGSCPTDRRGVMALLTEEGLARLRRASGTHLRGVRQHFAARLTPGQAASLAGALESLTASEDPA